MPGCNCPGQSCGCAIQAGPGVNMTGTGTASNPFIVGMDIRAITIEQSAAGSLDLSSYVGDLAVTVNVSANITDVILPSSPGTQFDLVLMTITTGRAIAWPADIRWVGGAAPTLRPTVGKGAWVRLRQTAGFWVGASVGEI